MPKPNDKQAELNIDNTGETNDTENIATEENDNIESEQTEDANIDEEESRETTGKDSGDVDEEVEQTEEEVEIDPRDEKISNLEKEILALKDGFKKQETQNTQNNQPINFNEEQKRFIQEKYGTEPGTADFVKLMLDSGLKNHLDQIKNYVEESLSFFKRGTALEQFSKQKGFEDAMQYKEGIEEFLSDWKPEFHSNPKLLERAYYYSKGKNTKSVVKKVMNNKDKNKTIITRMGKSGGEKVQSKSSSRLSDDERLAARAAGISEQEYSMYKNNSLNKIKVK